VGCIGRSEVVERGGQGQGMEVSDVGGLGGGQWVDGKRFDSDWLGGWGWGGRRLGGGRGMVGWCEAWDGARHGVFV